MNIRKSLIGKLLTIVAACLILPTLAGCDIVGKLSDTEKQYVYALYDVAADEPDRENLDARLDGTVARLLSMINAAGYMEATITREGATRIRVEVPDVEDPQSLFAIIGTPADLKFMINNEIKIRGSHVQNAYVTMHEGGEYAVQLILNGEGTALFTEVTTNNIGQAMSIVINDQEISRPTIQSAITNGKPVITGNFTYESADELAKQILSGALGVKLALIESDVVRK